MAARPIEKPALTTEEAASRTAMAASGAPDERGRGIRCGARDSGSGPTGCVTWKSCWITPRCGPRQLGFATVFAGEREEYKRHSKEPDWNKLKQMVAEPMNELHKRIAEEIRRRESPDALVPIDRDPVPPQFAEGVRRYYERLGSGQ